MSSPHKLRGVKILKAVSSIIRLQILNLLFDKGQLSYTELMSQLKMNQSRDAGKFAYHLKFLLKADLIEADVEARKYLLTDMGKMVIDVADKVEQKALKQKGTLIRTSRFTLEEFDSNKIANSLIREAKMPAELAQKVAKEAEKQLLKSKTKYLTAPLVREVVNAILIEKGLEEHRHKLTRLGLPVHEVTGLIETRTTTTQPQTSILETAGQTMLKEYTLLNILPRDIADAHISGALHINNLSTWILKPNETMHDLRFFLRNGLNLEKTNIQELAHPPAQNLEDALTTTLNILLHAGKETDNTQTLDYFNIFLAPYIKNQEPTRIKQALHQFITTISQHTTTSIGIELTTPKHIAEKPAINPSGKPEGKYGDYAEETQQLASLIIEILAETTTTKPLFNPKITIKIRPETYTNERAKAILLKTHNLTADKGTFYFANLLKKDHEQITWSASGNKLETDPDGDWEIDTLRTGNLGKVTINIPRIAHESNKEKPRFTEILKERLEMATRALEIKNKTLRQNSKRLLPFLTQENSGDQYFRLENCTWTINLAGLKEAAQAFCERNTFGDEKTMEFIDETAQTIIAFTQKAGKRRGKRLLPSILPDLEASERLAQLDIERYGIGKIRFSGTRDKPYYATTNKLTLHEGKIIPDSIESERKLQQLRPGGSLAIIELAETTYQANELMNITKQATEDANIEFFTYDRKTTYCVNCKKSWFGLLHKCPACGAVSTLATFDRFAST